MGVSRFFLCDLQVHTPADANQGYGDAGGREPSEEFAAKLIDAHAKAGVEVLAVSDHNRVDWYPVLRDAGERSGVWVFPAIEFSVNRCHLLAIWDRTDPGYRLAQQFLTSLWKPGEQPFDKNNDPRPVGDGQVREIATRASEEYKALVLAPHSTAKEIGFFHRGVCSNRPDVIESGVIAGYDVWGSTTAEVLKNPAAEFGSRRPIWFMSGDVRRFADVGTRAVYLKLGSEPTLEGLRQAFLMPESRIRFPESLHAKWSHVVGARFTASVQPSWPRLTSIKVSGGFHGGLDIEFAPGLNAIIGGKGTGKSTLIEILRFVLDAGEPAGDEAKGNRTHNFRANAEATVTYVDATADEYAVHRTGSPDPPTLRRGGELLDVDVARRAPVRVFGQRELQLLADQPEVLREFVAAEAGSAWSDALTTEKELRARLKRLDGDLQSVEAVLLNLEDSEHELADIDDRVRTATTKGAAEAIARQSALVDAEAKVRSALQWPDSVRSAGDALRKTLPRPAIPAVPSDHEEMAAALDRLAEVVDGGLTTLERALNAVAVDLEPLAVAWNVERANQRAQIERALADAGLTDPRELGQLQTRAGQLRGAISELPANREKHTRLTADWAEALQDLGDVRRLKSRLVEAAAEALDHRIGPRVRIRVEPLADKRAVVKALESSVKGQGVRAEQLRSLVDQHSPAAIAAAVREGQAAVEALGCSASTASKLCAVESSAVRRLEQVDTPDRIQVEVNLASSAEGDSWHDVADVSPGQRATALLALALAGGREPLIIDQPEDDLDNRYIYDEVVAVLARVCEGRQVIVATHNANIPILGDAEMVLALDAQASHAGVLAYGGLEDPTVAEWSRKILEGGEAAFQARHRRYQAAKS